MKALLGKKIGMTQVFTETGDCVPVTVIQVEGCVPVLKRTQEKNGYEAVLVAYGKRKAKHTNKPLQGVYKQLKIEPAKMLTEFRSMDIGDEELGKPLSVEMFKEGDQVQVTGTSKGKGFAGVMKRHGFGGHPASRGTHESFRGAGSIGMATYPGRVLKGHPMAGRMGGQRVCENNVQVVRVDAGNNILMLKGSVPGANGGIVRIIQK
ncbi:MAG: 50S ribosomal protein L3 [Nitrospinaceae bacterium]|nr:50S ribosomal protein L3 [Nitrospinaceae bacterium]NIR54544.1 50S ribosomal protein L3 [Nitrospinaceae bacterium]NIS84963.1 50S ribosomal protein L3 [Nitrospinaceae bacterium]NIT81777.1 50S ribosomal protein L3 [Nitrospinaceae bacterium]NIU44046.1 50S ribosomal protein L3 [Nitrospinaceae bacterium]